MKFYLTTTVKVVGGSSLCVYVPHMWKLDAGDEVNVTVRKAEDEGEHAVVFTYIATIRAANSGNGRKITIPKFFGLNAGDWVTLALEVIPI